jgi:hypothetical protein
MAAFVMGNSTSVWAGSEGHSGALSCQNIWEDYFMRIISPCLSFSGFNKFLVSIPGVLVLIVIPRLEQARHAC